MIDICFLSAAHPARDKRVFEKEARSLAEAGFAVAHICPGEQRSDVVERGVRIVEYQRPRTGGGRGRLASCAQLYREARGLGAAAYHCNEPDSWVVGVALKLRTGATIAFDAHEHYPSSIDRWVPDPTIPVARALLRLVLQLLGLVTDIIVLAKRSVAEDYSWSKRRHVLVLNTISVEALGEPVEREPATAPFTFVHTGVISEVRGAMALVEAMGIVRAQHGPDLRLVIVGRWGDDARDDFLARAEQLGVRDAIVETGWVTFDESLAQVKAADAGLVLFSKRYENNIRAMPHKMFDYMAAGIPLIAPDFAPEVAAILRDCGSAELVDTDDPVAVASAMRRLAEDPERALAMGRTGREAVAGRYSWEHDAARLVRAYRDVGIAPGQGMPRVA